MPYQCSADALQEISEYLRILYLCTALEDLHFLLTKIDFVSNILETFDLQLNSVKLNYLRFGGSEFKNLIILVFLFSKLFILRLQRKEKNLPNLYNKKFIFLSFSQKNIQKTIEYLQLYANVTNLIDCLPFEKKDPWSAHVLSQM